MKPNYFYKIPQKYKNYKIQKIDSGASKRLFYRLSNDSKSVIFVDSSDQKNDYINLIGIYNYLSKINISVNILDYPEKKAWPLMGEGKYDMFINGWSEITLDPDYNLKSNFLRNNRENLDNEILFDLINKAKNITVDEKRKLEYQKIQQNIMELQSRIPIYHAKDVWVFKKDIDFTPRQDRLIDLKDTRAV